MGRDGGRSVCLGRKWLRAHEPTGNARGDSKDERSTVQPFSEGMILYTKFMKTLVLGAMSIIAIGASDAQAQSAASGPPASPDVAPAASSGDQLQEVVVTAQRREENIQKVPIAVDVVSAASAKQSGVTDLEISPRSFPD